MMSTAQAVDTRGNTPLIPAVGRVPDNLTPAQLLASQGWFFLADVFRVLDPDSRGQYKLAFKQMEKLAAMGGDVHAATGRVKLGGRVAIRMERFADWYRRNPLFHVLTPSKGLDFDSFCDQACGTYRLSALCKQFSDELPLSYLSFIRLAERYDDSRLRVGIYKFQSTYLVVMPTFTKWLRTRSPGKT